MQQPELSKPTAQPYRLPQQRAPYNPGNQQQYQQPHAQGSTLEEKLNAYMDSMEKTKIDQDRKHDNLASTVRKLEVQIGQVAEQVPAHRQGKLPSQPETCRPV